MTNEVGCIVDCTDGVNYDGQEIVDLLNKLDLRIKCYKNDVVELADENKKLKSDCRYWKTLAESLARKNNKGGFLND